MKYVKLKKDTLKFLGYKNSYDLEVNNNDHNFIINGGIVSSNSHSVSYAMIAYQCSYLKHKYPLEFYTALLNNSSMDDYQRIINEIKKNKININQIDLNKSEKNFSIKDNKIYWGLSNINGIGDKASSYIIELRKNGYKFRGLKNFLFNKDFKWNILNKGIVEILIKIGAFDINGIDKRKLCLECYSRWLKYKNHLYTKKEEISSQKFISGTKKIFKEVVGNYSKDDFNYDNLEKMKIELDYYKINLMYNPFFVYNREKKINKLKDSYKAGSFTDEYPTIIVLFKNIKRFYDKNKNKMAFLDLIDIEGKRNSGIIFSSSYKESEIEENNVYRIRGSMQNKYIIDAYKKLDEIHL